MNSTTNTSSSVHTLNRLLAGEMSACETYDVAIDKVTDEQLKQQLIELEENHKRRVEMLRGEIARLDAEPVQTSGAWGRIARFLEGSAVLFGDKAAVSLLE